MSTIFDVASVSVDGGAVQTVAPSLTSIAMTVESQVANVSVTVPTGPELIQVAVPGVQGAPGVQNLYVSPTDPSAGWGMNEKDYIWVETTS